ncbi:MAG: hypothetical protein OEM03_05255 [Chromatiales bacterium]|nr:hypothetical protein [Chromatiales bacterium]
MTEQSPTRSAYLELQEELERLGEGYRFLDEKSMLLAHEMLRQLVLLEALDNDLSEAETLATAAFDAALARHGLDNLESYPGWDLADVEPGVTTRAFLGLALQSAAWPEQEEPDTPSTWMNSPEVHACRLHYLKCLQLQFELSLVGSNLLRLEEDYVRTERRARALDQLIMPQMRQSLRHIREKLDEIEQEENFSVRNAKNKTDTYRLM